jgi:hypothetical protein
MGLARFVVDAVVVEGRRPTEIAKLHGISRSWLYVLLDRYRTGGYAALEPRSRRPLTSPGRTAARREADDPRSPRRADRCRPRRRTGDDRPSPRPTR